MNSSFYDFQESLGYTTLICDVLMAGTLCVGLTGNIMICVVIYKTKALQTYINATLVCSALVDILGCSFLLPVRIYVYTFPLAHFNFLQICCQLGIFLRNLCDCVKLFMLTIGSFERYRAVVHPFNKEGRLQRTIILIGLSWFTALIFSSLSVVFFHDTTLYVHCFIEPKTVSEQWGKHEVFLILPLGLICLSAIFIFYTLILITLFKHSSIMKKRFSKRNKIHPVEEKHDKELDEKEYVPKMKIPTIIIEPSASSQHDINKGVSECDGNNETTVVVIEKTSSCPFETGVDNENKIENKTYDDARGHIDTGDHNSKCNIKYKANEIDLKSEYVNCLQLELNSTEIIGSGSIAMQVVDEKQTNVRPQYNYPFETNNTKIKTEKFLTTKMETKVHVGKAFYVRKIMTNVENSGNEEKRKQTTDEILLSTKCLHNDSTEESDNAMKSREQEQDKNGKENISLTEKALANVYLDKDLDSVKNVSKIEIVNKAKDKEVSQKKNNKNNAKNKKKKPNKNNNEINKKQRKYSKTVQVFDIEGKMKIGKTNNKDVVGAVCVMNPKNRIQGRRKVEIKAAKRILILIGTFILCWLPLPAFVLCVGEQSKLNLLEVQLVIIFGTVNGLNMAINPIQYGFCNRQILSAFKNIYNGC